MKGKPVAGHTVCRSRRKEQSSTGVWETHYGTCTQYVLLAVKKKDHVKSTCAFGDDFQDTVSEKRQESKMQSSVSGAPSIEGVEKLIYVKYAQKASENLK